MHSSTSLLWICASTPSAQHQHISPPPPALQFDSVISEKREWVGKGEDGFPVLEGKVDEVDGKNIEIWCVLDRERGGAERGSGLGGGGGREKNRDLVRAA